MKSIASAPGKIILVGEHFVVYGVKAILAAISKRITVKSEKIAEPILSIKSELGSIEICMSDTCKNPKLLPFEFIVKKMIDEFSYKGGIKIEIESEIPSGVGLGSSSAACVAAAASISRLFIKYGKKQICDLAIEAEKTIFKNTSGADITVSTFGGMIEYRKEYGFDKIKHKPNINLIIVNSEILHSTEEVVSKVAQFKKNNQERFRSLCEYESRLIEKIKSEIQNENPKTIGKSMKQNHEYLKEIGASNKKIEELIQISNTLTYGSKITGAGAGGCIISITEENMLNETLEKLEQNQIQCFAAKIDYTGLETF